MEKLYVQYRPDESAQRSLTAIQETLALTYPTAVPVPEREQHMSLLQIGDARAMFQLFRTTNRGLSQDNFMAQMRYFADRITQLTLLDTVAVPTKLSLFGQRHDVLAIGLDAEPRLKASHDVALRELARCLVRCGIKDAPAFLSRHNNRLHWQTFRPHVTLFHKFPDDIAPKVSVERKKLHLERLPVTYDLRHGRYT